MQRTREELKKIYMNELLEINPVFYKNTDSKLFKCINNVWTKEK